MKIKVIITGATGMVGEGILLESIKHPDVEKILLINRKPSGMAHPKITEIIHTDFNDLTPVAGQLAGYNACFFCLGVSSVNMKPEDYYSVTYNLTMHFAEILLKYNPDMTFCYISGAGTDSTEQGRIRWARIKGKTENDLIKLQFRKVFAFRPGFLQASPESKNIPGLYKIFKPLYPVLRVIIPNGVSTLKELGLAMINSVTQGYEKPVLEVKDIIKLSKR